MDEFLEALEEWLAARANMEEPVFPARRLEKARERVREGFSKAIISLRCEPPRENRT